jgi:hypothetical protein
VVRQVFRFALGRKDSGEDQPVLEALGERFERSGHSFTELLLDVVRPGSTWSRRACTPPTCSSRP